MDTSFSIQNLLLSFSQLSNLGLSVVVLRNLTASFQYCTTMYHNLCSDDRYAAIKHIGKRKTITFIQKKNKTKKNNDGIGQKTFMMAIHVCSMSGSINILEQTTFMLGSLLLKCRLFIRPSESGHIF